MNDLDDQLRAQGGACEHLARLFAHKRGMAESGFPCPPLSTTPWADALRQLLARIAELDARRCDGCKRSWTFGCPVAEGPRFAPPNTTGFSCNRWVERTTP